MPPVLDVLHVSDESGVAKALADAMSDRVTARFLSVRQVGRSWPTLVKPLALGPRFMEARRIRRLIEAVSPRPDVLHIHWLPNGLVGLSRGPAASRIPWVVHLHGSDIRDIGGWRAMGYRHILQAADAVVYSTPDLTPHVHRWRPDGVLMPTPIDLASTRISEARWDVFGASEAIPVKGAGQAFEVFRALHAARPNLRLAALTGKAFEHGPWENVPLSDKSTFHERLASARIVLGQLKLGAAGIVELEAMALGRPVVGWINVDYYTDPPPIVSAPTPDRLVRSTLALLDDPARQQELGDAGHRWVRKHHDPEAIARKLLAIYNGIRVGTA